MSPVFVTTAEMFMSKTGIDKQPHGRSEEVNNTRTKVWRRIQEEANVQFNSLKPYYLVQVAEMDVDDTPIYKETDDIQIFQDKINYDNSIRKLQDSR
ncbi:unnamed protein product [Caenorhabditis nigoni]